MVQSLSDLLKDLWHLLTHASSILEHSQKRLLRDLKDTHSLQSARKRLQHVAEMASEFSAQTQTQMASSMKTLSWTQLSLVAFIAFTVVQIVLFLFAPSVYALVTPDMDFAPVYPAFRIIGLKEIGLMTTYATLVAANDARLFAMTVIGRFTVLPEFLILVFVVGAPVEFLGGIVQDLSSLALTCAALTVDKRTLVVPKFRKAGFEEKLVRLLIAATGIIEIFFGVMAFALPTKYSATPLIPLKWVQPPLFIGPRSVGMMGIAVGAYQLCISWLRADQKVYIAVGFMNTSFYMLTRILSVLLRSAYPGGSLHPPIFPFLLGVPTLALSIGAIMNNIEEKRPVTELWDAPRKKKV